VRENFFAEQGGVMKRRDEWEKKRWKESTGELETHDLKGARCSQK
jgi:hypothetical protein